MNQSYQLMMCACPDQASATQLAEQLVKKKLAACVSIVSGITSIYRWENQIENTTEYLLQIKTITENCSSIMSFIQSHHPYQVPEIIALSINAGAEKYLQWLADNCR